MSKYTYMLIPVTFAFLAIVAIVATISTRKAVLQTTFAASIDAGKTNSKNTVVSPAERMAARQVIEGLARANDLPLKVSLNQDGSIDINIETTQKTTAALDPKSAVPDPRTTVLSKFDGIVSFLQSMAVLPYHAKYKSLCIGLGCPTGMDVSVLLSNPGEGA